ncbi:hypothetical protein GC175_02345 [bacterium]|nr:hypothetical protein [bacterium]
MSKRGKIDIGGLGNAAEERPVAATPAQNVSQTASTPPPRVKPESEPTPQAEKRASPGRSYDPPPRRPRQERKNAFDVGSWLIEGVLGIAEEVRHNDLGLPEEFWTHAYAARREALLAARALIDTALERFDEEDDASARREAGRRQRGPVNVNFD